MVRRTKMTIFVKHILKKCGVIVQQDTYGNCYYFLDKTREELTEDDAMELVEQYIINCIRCGSLF